VGTKTLVVDTTNFIENEFDLIPHGGGGNGTYLGAGERLHLVERFTRVDADNHGLPNTLSGGRAEERAAGETDERR
jgi:hypothetical protein